MDRCPRCSGLIVLNHDEEFCINCSWRPANDLTPEIRERSRCYYCGKRPPNIERSNLACDICLDRQANYKRKKLVGVVE
jgi:hypothetical protein